VYDGLHHVVVEEVFVDVNKALECALRLAMVVILACVYVGCRASLDVFHDRNLRILHE
jgi:hypothetical protein